MATKNIVPRADNEGSLGTDAKRWATAKIVTVTGNLVGAVTGNAATATTLTGALSKTLGGAGDVTGILKANGSGVVSAAAGSDLLSTHGTQTANTVLAGPTTGAAANPTFRALVAGDWSGVFAPTSSAVGIPNAAEVTKGLYARTTPTPDGGSKIRPLCVDANVAGRIWAVGFQHAKYGFTDDHGVTFTAKGTIAGSSGAIQGAIIDATYMWVLTSTLGAANGQLWRSPKPAADGTGLSWTKVFDLAAPPAPLTVGDQSCFWPLSLAVSGANVYLIEYSGATITGGPSIFYSSDSGATWSKPKTWANAKHAHAVNVIGGVPWVTLGDAGATNTDVGLWTASTAAATTWAQRTIYGEALGGTTFYGINFLPVTVLGQTMVAFESDSKRNAGPMIFPSQDPTKTSVLQPSFYLPTPYIGTMRQMTLTADGNLMWVQTGENGSVGPLDSIWISKPPFTKAILLESFASNNSLGTLGKPVVDGDYVWFGTSRCRKEEFPADGAGAFNGIGGGSPTDATYITQTATPGLSAEQSLGALTTGILLNTVTDGVGVLSTSNVTNESKATMFTSPTFTGTTTASTIASPSVDPEQNPASHGYLAWTYPVRTTPVTMSAVTRDAYVLIQKIWIPKTITVTSITALCGATLLTNADAFNGFGLYSSAGVLIAKSADQATEWASGENAFKTANLSAEAGQSLTITGGAGVFVYGAILANTNGGTTPSWAYMTSIAKLLNVGQVGTAGAPTFTCAYLSGQAAFPATIGATASDSYAIWMALS